MIAHAEKELFPDCKIHLMEQRTDEWFEARKGKLTGSQFGTWLAEKPECRYTASELRQQISELVGQEPPKNMTKAALLGECQDLGINLPKTYTKTTEEARKKAIAKIIGQMSSCIVPDEWGVDPDGPPPRNRGQWAIWNGIKMESEAEQAFEVETGEVIRKVGFCTHYSQFVGVSPDGLIRGKNIGFEGKAPLPETHALYLLNGELPEQYKAQVHGSMAATGADAWWFQSYCPGLPTLRILVERDEFTERMETGINLFADHLRQTTLEIIGMMKGGRSE
jgi:hypothetical protein